MKSDKFIKNSLIVTSANLITGMLAFVFSIVLSRKLGTEGMGLYGLVSPVYSLALCLVAEGLITALSKLSAVFTSRKDFINLNRTVETSIIFIIIWASFIALVLYIGAGVVASKIINDTRTVYALRILCPALLIVPMSAIFKGYFYGIGKFYISSFIDISEKAMRVAFLVSVIWIMSFNDVASTVSTAYGAVTLGEFVSFTLLFIWYGKYRNKLGKTGHKPQNRIQLLFNILAISLPLCINGIFSSILYTTSTLLLPRRLMTIGISYSDALSLIGKFSGMALNITFFPLIIIGSMSTVLVPDLSQKLTTGDFWSVEKRIMQVFKIAALVGVGTLVLNQVVGNELGELFYKRNDLGDYIRFASLTSFFTFIAIPSYGILNGLGRQKIILRNSLIVSVIEIVLIYFLTAIPKVNIYGLGLTLVITSIIALIINIIEIRKMCELKLPIADVLKLIFIGVITFITVKFMSTILPTSLPLIKCVVLALLAFAIPLSSFKAMDLFKRNKT